jgi:hypothetical protein
MYTDAKGLMRMILEDISSEMKESVTKDEVFYPVIIPLRSRCHSAFAAAFFDFKRNVEENVKSNEVMYRL